MNIEVRKAYFRKRYADRKAKAIKYLGGKCVICGSIEGLELDHKDPTSKHHEFSHLFMLSEHNPNWKIELDKCQLLCDKHHNEKSGLEKTIICPHGKKTRECKECKKAYMKDYMYARRAGKKFHARLAQLAEAIDLKSIKSEFKSQDGHHTGDLDESQSNEKDR